MEQRPNSCSTLATSCGDNLNGNANNSPPDAFNFELSDLVDDLLVLAYADTAPGADVGGSLLLSTLPQRIDALRSMVQEAQDICRARPVATAAAAVGTSAPPNRCVQRRDQSQQHQLQLFQTACDLDPRAQKDLLSALGSACVTKRQLLADLNEELVKLSEQNDQFTL